MVKNYFFLFLLLFSIPLFSQIKITEIYHDTPYNERMTLFNGNTQQCNLPQKPEHLKI